MTDDFTPHEKSTYLIVADETEEFQVALRFAALVSKTRGDNISILFVMSKEDFQHWGNVQERIHMEQRAEAEKLLWDSAKKVNDITGLTPGIYLEEGGRPEVIMDIIDRDLSIKRLILGAGTEGGGPGPLVDYFTGKGLPKLRVPLTIVPGDIPLDKVEDMI